jgi:hypothetical protein
MIYSLDSPHWSDYSTLKAKDFTPVQKVRGFYYYFACNGNAAVGILCQNNRMALLP